jgi:hypothetical protein
MLCTSTTISRSPVIVTTRAGFDLGAALNCGIVSNLTDVPHPDASST